MATSTIAPIVDLLIMTDLPVASFNQADERCTDYFNKEIRWNNRLEHGR